MNKSKIKLISLFIVIIFAFSGIFSASATDNKAHDKKVVTISQATANKSNFVYDGTVQVQAKNGKIIRFSLEEKVLGKFSTLELYDFANEYQDRDDIRQININDIVYADKNTSVLNLSNDSVLSEAENNQLIATDYDPHHYVNYYYYPCPSPREEFIADDRFMTSVPKGGTLTLQADIISTLEASVLGGTDLVKAGLTASLQAKLSVGLTLTGPPETSECNSREYRVRFFEYQGTWEEHHLELFWWTVTTGTFTEPSRYLMYSIDVMVS